ncbi:MAG: DNA repair protein RecO [Desulfuromonadales bacterium]
MHPEKLQAIVLSSTDYGDSDRIASLFSLEHGRLSGFARGARNSRKRFGPALETFARIEIHLLYKDGLSSLRHADVITVYPHIRNELVCIAHALYACELTECITPEGQPLPRLYRLLTAYLERLDAGHAGDVDRRFFELNLLNILGYRPSLEGCSHCGFIFTESDALMQQGGELVCRYCAVTGRHIAVQTLRGLLSCLSTGRFGLVQFSEDGLLQAGALLDAAVAAHSGRKLKTLDFLRQTNG